MIENNVMNLFFVLLSIFGTVLFLMGKWKMSSLLLVNIIVVDVNLLGMMYFWNIGLSTVSIVNLLISLGLAVDACVHVM